MDFNANIDLIIRELEEAREIIDDLRKFPGVPVIQIELAKSKCRNAAEVIRLLKNHQKIVAAKASGKQPDVTAEDKSVQPGAKDIQGILSEEFNEEIPEQFSSDEKNEPAGVGDRKKQDHATVSEAEDDETADNENKPFVAPIIADTFSHLANSFNEKLSGQPEDDFSFIKNKHWSGLSTEIGINDQFYFIREVFNGDRNSYSEALARLEKASDITEAKAIIMSFRNDKKENEAVKQLLDLIKRKFYSHE
jgi:hypothetical protein